MFLKLDFAFWFEAICEEIQDAFEFLRGSGQQSFDWIDDVNFEFIRNVSQILIKT